MTRRSSLPLPERPLEGELRMAGRMGAIAAGVGAITGTAVWIFAPSLAGPPVPTALAIGLSAAIGIVCLVLPWDRVSQRWTLLPIIGGVLLTALASANALGTQSPFDAFFVFLAAMAGYFCTRAQGYGVLALIVVAAGLPVIYDLDASLVERLEGWGLRSLVSAGILVLLQHARSRARDSTSRLQVLAMQDSLTGIANRRAFELRAAAETARARRHDGEFTVAFLDLDGFKAINDVHGHAAGDRMLRRVSHAIEGAVRGEDFVGRLGGDEFGVLLPGATGGKADAVLARIDAAVRRVSSGEDGFATLSASAGSAAFPRDGASLDELLGVADGALRAEKSAQLGRPHPVLERLAPADAEPHELSQTPRPRLPVLALAAQRRLLVVAAGLALVAVAWIAVGALGVADVARPAILFAAVAADVLLSAVVARRAEGSERVGWALIAAGGALAFVPLAGAAAALLFGIGLVLVARVWPRDAAGALDAASLLSLIAMCAVAFIALPALDLSTGLGRAGAPGSAAITTFMLWCSAAVFLRTRPAARPDAWLAAGGFVVGAAGSIPFLFSKGFDPIGLPTDVWQVSAPLAVAMIAAAAWVRLALGPVSDRWEVRRGLGTAMTVMGVVAFAAALAVIAVAYGGIPAAVVPPLLLAALFRGLRVWVTERENERLVDVARAGRADLAEQYRATLLALGATLEARDGYTGLHGAETLTLVTAVARRLGLSDEEIDHVATVARLHDLGKIGVPNEILLKPGPLDDGEWRIMRRHPVIGERILRTVPGLVDVARAVRHEHERWDGGGYPDGLAAEEIPLASRLVLVCDAYHAMTSDRPYRTALSKDTALEELRRHSGTHCPPAVVQALRGERGDAAPTGPAGPAESHQAAS